MERTQNCQNNFENNKVEGILQPDPRCYCNATGIETVWYWRKARPTYTSKGEWTDRGMFMQWLLAQKQHRQISKTNC